MTSAGRPGARAPAAGRTVLFDPSGSWVEGSHCELAAFGHSRDGKPPRKATAAGQPVRGFRDLLDHLATLTGQVTTIGDHQVEKITIPTPAPRQAFDLLGVPLAITLE